MFCAAMVFKSVNEHVLQRFDADKENFFHHIFGQVPFEDTVFYFSFQPGNRLGIKHSVIGKNQLPFLLDRFYIFGKMQIEKLSIFICGRIHLFE